MAAMKKRYGFAVPVSDPLRESQVWAVEYQYDGRTRHWLKALPREAGAELTVQALLKDWYGDHARLVCVRRATEREAADRMSAESADHQPGGIELVNVARVTFANATSEPLHVEAALGEQIAPLLWRQGSLQKLPGPGLCGLVGNVMVAERRTQELRRPPLPRVAIAG